MKKFKEFYRSVTNPQTAEDWIEVALTLPEFETPHSDQLQGKKLHDEIVAYLKKSSRFRQVGNEKFGRTFKIGDTDRLLYIKVLHIGSTPHINLFWHYDREGDYA